MKIRDKIIFSFLSVVCLLFVSVLVKFYGIVKTYSLIEPSVMQEIRNAEQNEALNGKSSNAKTSHEKVGEDPIVDAHFSQMFKTLIEKDIENIVKGPSDGSSLLLLNVCKELKDSLTEALTSVVQLPYSLDSSFASKESAILRKLTADFESDLEILQVTSKEDLRQNSLWNSWKKTSLSEGAFLVILNKNSSAIQKLVGFKTLQKVSEKVIIAFGEKRFSREAKVKELQDKAKKGVAEFSKELLSTGVGAAPEVVADLNNSILAVLSTTGTADLRKEWAKLSAVFDSIPSSLPAAGVNNLIDSVLSQAEKLHKQWHLMIKARIQHFDILEKGQWVINSYKNQVASAMAVIGNIESFVLADVAVVLKGSEGVADKLATIVTNTCNNIPDSDFASFSGVKTLKARAESHSWRRLYNNQIGDLTFLMIIFCFGIVLSVILGLAVFRDISNPLYILKKQPEQSLYGWRKTEDQPKACK